MSLIRNGVKIVLKFIYKLMLNTLPIKSNVILFESNLGKNYTGNPKAIYEKMVEKGYDEKYKCVWIVDDINVSVPGNCTIIKKFRFRYLYYLSVSKYWVFDCRQPSFIKKRDDIIYIQTWHGTPLKKLALDMEVLDMGGDNNLEVYKENFKNDSSRWDYLLSQNHYSTEIFRSAFGFNKEILEYGYPRNDILFHTTNYDINVLKRQLNLPLDKNIVLYAPTWRDNSFYKKGQYKFDTELDINYLKQELGDEYIIIIKAHYLVVNKLKDEGNSDFVYSFSHDQDISELYLVSDLLVTDYSSVMFDYSILNRPIIFFTYDYEEYRDSLRGFYFNLNEEAPGPLVKTNKELVNSIMSANEDYLTKYQIPYQNFKEKYNNLDDGRASERLIDHFFVNG